MTATRVGAALAALLASVAIPLSVRADPSQPAAAGFLLSAGAPETIVLDHTVSSAELEPGAIIPAHLRDAIVVRGKTLAAAGTQVHLIVTQIRRAGNGVGGEVVFRVEPVHLTDDLNLPLRLLHPALNATLVLANPEDIVLPAKAKNSPALSADLTLPPGTQLRARTTLTVDATNPNKTVLASPMPYTITTDRPYAAFTPIPLTTYNPNAFTPPPRRRGRATPTPSPSPSPSQTATESPTPSPSPTPTQTPV